MDHGQFDGVASRSSQAAGYSDAPRLAHGRLRGTRCAGRSSVSVADEPPRPGLSRYRPRRARQFLNDASQLCPTRVSAHLTIGDGSRAGVVDRIRAALAEARAAKRPFIASAARHSMGGQSLAKDGTVATLDQQWLEADRTRKVYRVAAGSRWSTVIARLDALGFSPVVMQSNNNFGVASTFAVNAHGWPVTFSGCGSTTRALTMILADGSLVTCSRTENADLFRHAMGGYGLFE